MLYQFSLQNEQDEDIQYYQVNIHTLLSHNHHQSNPKPIHHIQHHLILIDRSISTASQFSQIQNHLLKLLTLQEYSHANMQVSLFSYTGQDDIIIHACKEDISTVHTRYETYMSEIKSKISSKKSKLSTALFKAIEYVDDTEISMMTFHSLNHFTPNQKDRSQIDLLIQSLKQKPVQFSSILYHNTSDTDLRYQWSNDAKGYCIDVQDLKKLYDTLHDCSELMMYQHTAHHEIQCSPNELCTILSASAQSIQTTQDRIWFKGLKIYDDYMLYRFTPISSSQFKKQQHPTLDFSSSLYTQTLMTLSASYLQLKQFNFAKYCLFSVPNHPISLLYKDALTPKEVTQWQEALHRLIFQSHAKLDSSLISSTVSTPTISNPNSTVSNPKISLYACLRLLRSYKEYIDIHKDTWIDYFKEYSPPLSAREVGTRDDSGNTIKPKVQYAQDHHQTFFTFQNIHFNQNMANIQLIVAQDLQLMDDQQNIHQDLAGITLKHLKKSRSYSILQDGQLKLKTLHIKIKHKGLFARLHKLDLIQGEYYPTHTYQIDLSNIPLVKQNEVNHELSGIFDLISQARMIKSFLAQLMRTRSAIYTQEQLNTLQAHHITPSLNLSLPTRYKIPKVDALEQGLLEIDHRYKFTVGDSLACDWSLWPSARRFLQQYYQVMLNDQSLDKPDCWDALSQQFVCVHQQKTSLKPSPTFIRFHHIFDELLGHQSNGAVKRCLSQLGLSTEMIQSMDTLLHKGIEDQAEDLEIITHVLEQITQGINHRIEIDIVPYILYLRRYAVLPKKTIKYIYQGTEISNLYPQLKLRKHQKEASFFTLDETCIIQVSSEDIYLLKTDNRTCQRGPSSHVNQTETQSIKHLVS